MLFRPTIILSSSTKRQLLLLLILIVALLVRLYNLTGKPLWYDEACSVADAQKALGYFFGAPYTFNYKILYFLLLKGWIRLFGPWDYPMRILSVFLGVLSTYLIYRLASLLYNYRVGLWSAFLLSLSTFHIYHSQQVRQYALIVTLAILSFYLFAKFLFYQKNKYVLLHPIINFLLLSTHPYGILVVVLQYGLCLSFRRRILKKNCMRWIVLQSIGLGLYLSFFLIPSGNYLLEKVWWVPRPSPLLLVELFSTLTFGGPRYGLDDYRLPLYLVIISAVFSLVYYYFFLCGIRATFLRDGIQQREKVLAGGILLSWLFFPIVTAYALSYIKPAFLIKHLIYVLPPFLIVTAKGIESLRRISLRRYLVVSVIVSSIVSLHTLYSNDYNINWRPAAKFIKENLRADEVIAVCSAKEIVPFIFYFDYGNVDKLKTLDIYGRWSSEGWQEVFKYNNEIIVGIRQKTPHEPKNPFKDFRNKYAENKFSWRDKNIWLAVSRWGSVGNFPEIEKRLAKTHSKFVEENFNGVSVSYWKKL